MNYWQQYGNRKFYRQWVLDNTDSWDNVNKITCAKMLRLQNPKSSGSDFAGQRKPVVMRFSKP